MYQTMYIYTSICYTYAYVWIDEHGEGYSMYSIYICVIDSIP
jgi:hypothetical protein